MAEYVGYILSRTVEIILKCIKQLKTLIKELVSHSQETEWLEFKLNFHSNQEIGVRISALANGACLSKKQYVYRDTIFLSG